MRLEKSIIVDICDNRALTDGGGWTKDWSQARQFETHAAASDFIWDNFPPHQAQYLEAQVPTADWEKIVNHYRGR